MYVVLGGLHSSETGPPEMLMELAYRLAVEDSPVINGIRANVIVAINPATDPDGRDRYTDWYYRNKIDDTDDLSPVHNVPYWGKYIYHDNNRDINFTGLSARNLLAFYLQWHPPIMHDLHESVAISLHIQRAGAAKFHARSDPLRRNAMVREFRGGAIGQVRHARRLDPRLRRHVVARLRGLHVV